MTFGFTLIFAALLYFGFTNEAYIFAFFIIFTSIKGLCDYLECKIDKITRSYGEG